MKCLAIVAGGTSRMLPWLILNFLTEARGDRCGFRFRREGDKRDLAHTCTSATDAVPKVVNVAGGWRQLLSPPSGCDPFPTDLGSIPTPGETGANAPGRRLKVDAILTAALLVAMLVIDRLVR